ncbi:MAG: NADPH-dependent F420 reductase [Myxococcales bacterium]|nr:NADPH-dependent F420 reductase [Myxococcales bacterium]MCB9628674.1 NADPH-dependent F420 reductase [Sandaracinaceae bacterium]
MRIGLVGGTGREGTGLALRWARAGHEVFVGSRDSERGVAKAAELAAEHGITLSGGDNLGACAHGEVVIVTVPYSAHAPTFASIREAVTGKVVVDITVPLKPPKVRSVQLPAGSAAALESQAILGDGATVVAALHHISSEHLGDPAHEFDCDVLLCGEKDARETVAKLIEDLGLRAIEAGTLENAVALESMTPVLLFINKKYGATAGLRITGMPG